jgi:hypothetical protein
LPLAAAGQQIQRRQEDVVAQELDRIGFVVHHPEMFHHYDNILRHMPKGSVEIAISPSPKPVFESIVECCTQRELTWRDADELLRNKQRYTTAVSPFPVVHDARRTKPLARFSVRMMYGNGKAGWNFRDWNSMYDSILCFGPYQAQSLSRFENTLKIQMGYPRFDSFFNEPIDREARLLELGLDPARRTLVWLPTWSHLCSIMAFAPAVTALQEQYNVIVKPHPFTATKEPKRMQALSGIRCVMTELNNVQLFQLADLVLSDYGGSPFGAIYTDRDQILLDVPNAESDAYTGKDSSDVELRKYIPHVAPDQPELLGVLLTEQAADIWAEQRRVRAVLRELHFAPYFGYSGQVAALALLNTPRALTRMPQWLSG